MLAFDADLAASFRYERFFGPVVLLSARVEELLVRSLVVRHDAPSHERHILVPVKDAPEYTPEGKPVVL